MATNKYLKNFNSPKAQFMAERLNLQAIKMFGYDVRYISRKLGSVDHIFGEDKLSTFENAPEVEVYIKNIDGFAGQGRFLSKFGIEIRDQITFTIAKIRWEQIRTEKILSENGLCLQLEDRMAYTPNQTSGLMLEEGSIDAYSIQSDRPLEGDLIYFPMTNRFFEIKYVNYETVFYQFGALQIYDLDCEVFEYSSEVFDTKDTVIDSLANSLSSDILFNELVMEDGFKLIDEDDSSIIHEDVNIEDSNVTANNSLFRTEAANIIDWSQISPLDYITSTNVNKTNIINNNSGNGTGNIPGQPTVPISSDEYVDFVENADTVLSALRGVRSTGANTVEYCDSSITSHSYSFLGITATAGSSNIIIRTSGELDGFMGLTPNAPVYLSINGYLTQVPPTSGFLLRVGFARTSTVLYIDPGRPIILL